MRKGAIHYSSKPQQHSFNFPYQLQYRGQDLARDADVEVFSVELGDVLILGSDGLFDNLYLHHFEECLSRCLPSNSLDPEKLAKTLALLAHEKAMDRSYNSPFATEAMQAGKHFQGGKMDDISVVVAYVAGEQARL